MVCHAKMSLTGAEICRGRKWRKNFAYSVKVKQCLKFCYDGYSVLDLVRQWLYFLYSVLVGHWFASWTDRQPWWSHPVANSFRQSSRGPATFQSVAGTGVRSVLIFILGSCIKSDYYGMLSVQPTNELSAPVLCRQKVFSGRLKSSFGGVRIVDWVRKTVPGGRTSNGERPAAVRVESVTWYMQQILLSRMETSLAGQ